MVGEANNTTTNRVTNFNFNININNQIIEAGGGTDAIDRSLNLFRSIEDRIEFGSRYHDRNVPRFGSIVPPDIRRSGPPAGEGLTIGADGFPTGTVADAAGWKVFAEGNASIKIWAPGQNAGDTPWTHIHGDPHVTQIQDAKTGKSISYDFTKDSNFILPSGTKLFIDTDYDATKGNGQSISRRIVMTAGADRVEIDGVGEGQPTIGPITPDAYEWSALHLTNPAANQSNKYGQAEVEHDSFYGSGDLEHSNWTRERQGRIDGVVTGTERRDVGGHQIYDQITDPTLVGSTSRDLLPPVGSRAWGNQIRSELNDAQARLNLELFGPNRGAVNALQNSYGIHANHIQGEFRADALDIMFGGLPGYFNNYNPFSALYDMLSLLREDQNWRQQYRNRRYDDRIWM